MWMWELRAVVIMWLSLLAWCQEEQIMALSGTDVTFKVNTTDNPSEINWFIDGNKIVDLVQGYDPDYFRLQDRATASLSEKTLTIKNVSPKDKGRYSVELVVEGRVLPSSFFLQVYDSVCKVVIDIKDHGNNVTLQCRCSDQGDPPDLYQWFKDDDKTPKSNNPTYNVSKTKHQQLYTCVASNKVSKESARVIVPPPPTENEGLSPGAIAAIVISIILISIGGVFAYRFRERIRRSFARSTTEPSAQGGNGDVNEKLNIAERSPSKDGASPRDP